MNALTRTVSSRFDIHDKAQEIQSSVASGKNCCQMKEEKTKAKNAGCLPFKAHGLFEPPVKRTRKRYVMKQSLQEWDGAKLLSLVRHIVNNLAFVC